MDENMHMQSEMPSGTQASGKRKMGLWSSLILIVVAGLAGYFIGRGNASAPAENPAMAEKESASAMEKENSEGAMIEEKKNGPLVTVSGGESPVLATATNLVEAQDQLSGSRVTLDRIVLKNEGWVAIHDAENGAPGRILGAALTAAGTHDDFTVDLVRSTEAGASYIAMLHTSNGDREFQFRAGEADAPLVNGEGNPIMAAFKTL